MLRSLPLLSLLSFPKFLVSARLLGSRLLGSRPLESRPLESRLLNLRLFEAKTLEARRSVPVLAAALAALTLAMATIACAAAAPPTPAPIPTSLPPAAARSNPPAGIGNSNGNGNINGGGGQEITPILATRVLDVGTQRVSFLLSGKKALIKAPEATVSATYLGNTDLGDTGLEGAAGDGEDAPANPPKNPPAETRQAIFHLWPYGIRGAYSTEFNFDRPGRWRLDVTVDDGDFSGATQLEVAVVEQSAVPGIGSRPPLSRSKTLDEVDDIAQLTTDYEPDPDLYRISVAEAIESPRPAVIVFASPAFCVSATCGPQVDAVTELKETYRGRADFVHVELYDRPEEIQGDLSRAELAGPVREWGFTDLPEWFNESWVYILNDAGLVEQRFEGFATLTELEAALQQVLGEE